MPAQETVRASFFMRRDGGARRGLFAGRFVYGMVCLRDCLRDCLRGGLPAGRTVCGSGIFSRTRSGPEPGNRTGKQGNREAGNRGRKSGRLVVSGQWSVVSGQWSVVSGRIGRPVGGRFAGRMFPGRGEWPFLRSPKYLRRISCTVRNNPVYLQVRTEEANR